MRVRTLEADTTCQKTMPSIKNSKSLRATVPAIVVSMLGLKPGDRLHWTLDVATGHVSVAKKSPA
jgi:hypothetical protein